MNRPLKIALGWHGPDWLLDYGPVAFVLLEGAVAIHASGNTARLDAWATLALIAGALVFRHRHPLAVLGALVIIAVIRNDTPVVILPVLLTMFTVAEYRDRTTVVIAGLVTVAGMIVGEALHVNHVGPPAVISHLVAVGMAVALGLYIRARADYVTGLQERAQRLEREQDLMAQQAAGEERVRIARELHDVVAHNVSLMVVQAQALQATGANPEQAAALGHLATIGRDALSEMHRMLGVLRPGGDGPERSPQPGVGDIPALVERTAAAGVEPQLEIKGARRSLPPAIDLSAYRIVQEALTNVIRHAGASHVEVELSYEPSELLLTIVDDGNGSTAGTSEPAARGHGLIGMRERAALFGGSLEAGPRSGARGYRIHARLPTDDSRTPAPSPRGRRPVAP